MPSPFLVFTTPVQLSTIPDSPDCAICKEPLSAFDPAVRSQEQEYPVRVDIAATPTGSVRLCGHIFGRKCLEQHLRTKGPWSKNCPLCRRVWFKNEEKETENTHSALSSTLRLSWFPRPERQRHREHMASAGQSEAGAQPDEETFRQSFMQQVLDALEAEKGSREVRGSVEDVERALQKLYQKLGVPQETKEEIK
ncbi:hypothetical protein K491DRAFT_676360 [Lophiostoma macrostomum CBS 122681]|uniref:RING-type domain-containing protein n=1 Tax=Lophiostoma macrostomum CBS 122681 TaxID=1314788 RepID=A0A6A6TIU2_9PLEO|nr:hypothetical protein K491DRAFT_676360 [Lophiostoma macrostomum CBS 122681]